MKQNKQKKEACQVLEVEKMACVCPLFNRVIKEPNAFCSCFAECLNEIN